MMSRDNSVGIAPTTGIESRWGRDFPHLSRQALGPHPASCVIGTASLSRGKAAGAWR